MSRKLSAIVIIAFQICILCLFNFGPFSSDIDFLVLNGLSLKQPILPPKAPKKGTSFHTNIQNLILIQETGSYFKKTFPNPTAFENIREPIISPESYIPRLEISCYVYDPDHLSIIIRDADKPRYEIPFEDPYPHPKNPQYLKIEESNFDFEFQEAPFDFIVKRKSTKEVIFKLTDRLVYTDLYLEFSFYTPTKEIYGLGMRVSTFQFKPGTYSLFLIDRSGFIDHGQPGFNAQGHHSMYLMKENSGNYHIFLLRNVNFGEVTIYGEGNKMKWQLIGGVLDFNFFLGASPESVVDKYHQYLGGWSLPGFWHMGYHQNKWGGYHNVHELRAVLEGFQSKNIPLESLWTDQEHMIEDINFSIDESRFPLDKVRELYETYKKRWIPLFNAYISTPFISPVSEYPNIEELYMGDSLGQICDGRFLSWERVIWMDFLNPKCEHFWDKMIWETDKKWELSGLWLDANEISNQNRKNNPFNVLKNMKRRYYNLPFYPGGANLYDLDIVNLDCIHYNGQEEFNMRVWNALFQSKYSYDSLKKKSPYPFILSRATMIGGGKYSTTWIPDIWSTWENLKISTGVLLNYGLFGYAKTGVDICGFVSPTQVEPELCARWHQAATFYPFARNSHVLDFASIYNYQEPYLFNGIFFDTIHSHIQLRYSILKYYYTLFFTKKAQGEADDRKIGTLVRPLFYDYYNDSTLPPYGHDVHESQALLGEAIMITTISQPQISSLDVYFPNKRWYDLRTYQEVPIRGGTIPVSAALNEIVPHFLKGGNILLKQNVDGVMRSEDLSNIFHIIAGLDDFNEIGESKQSSAEGKILAAASYDEHYVYNHCTKQNCILSIIVTFEHNEGRSTLTLKAKEEFKNSSIDPIQVSEILLMGVPKELVQEIKNVKLEGYDNIQIDLEVSVINMNLNLKFPEYVLNIENEIIYKFIFS